MEVGYVVYVGKGQPLLPGFQSSEDGPDQRKGDVPAVAVEIVAVEVENHNTAKLIVPNPFGLQN